MVLNCDYYIPILYLTVNFPPFQTGGKHYKGTAVSPDAPRKELGTYWGYRVRLADTFSATFTECSYKEGYDLTIGTSDKGDSVDSTNIRHFRLTSVFTPLFEGVCNFRTRFSSPMYDNKDPQCMIIKILVEM